MKKIHISRRTSMPAYKAWLIRLACVLAALVVCALVIYAIVQMNPIDVYVTMFEGAFGTARRCWITIREAMTLLCIAVGLAPAFTMRFWNTGAEGQVLVGGIATAAVMIYLGNRLPTFVLIILMMVVSAVAGGIWGIIPAYFKAKYQTNETLFTLMMNYIAIQLTNYFVTVWEHPEGSNSVGIINTDTHGGWLPSVFGQQYFLNVVIVLVITFAVYAYLKRTKQGYEIAVVGSSERTAKYIGINVSKVIVRTMALSGAICGIAGFLLVSGSSHTISNATANGRGFTAIIVAWLAKFNTFSMILISFLLVFLDRGASEIASIYNLNEYASKILQGIILFFILGSEFFINYKINFGSKEEK